jgi:hypothetical protein
MAIAFLAIVVGGSTMPSTARLSAEPKHNYVTSPVKRPKGTASTSLFLDETKNFWQTRTARHLTNEDARQIVENVAGVFSLLAEWDAKKKPGGAAPAAEPANNGVAGGVK